MMRRLRDVLFSRPPRDADLDAAAEAHAQRIERVSAVTSRAEGVAGKVMRELGEETRQAEMRGSFARAGRRLGA